jgi:hypothetical protein
VNQIELENNEKSEREKNEKERKKEEKKEKRLEVLKSCQCCAILIPDKISQSLIGLNCFGQSHSSLVSDIIS